jgi:hypothetical protein
VPVRKVVSISALLPLLLAACEQPPPTVPKAASGAASASPRPPAAPRPSPPRPSPRPPSRLTPPPGSGHPPNPFYRAGDHGYDVSYPQCPRGGPPSGSVFGIVGVNRGKAFTVNPCLVAQWSGARQPRAGYLNSGYDPDNQPLITTACQDLGSQLLVADAWRTAYALGCSETTYALGAVRANGLAQPAMWWIDVESSNSWDLADVNLNRYALQGEIDQLAAIGRPVGVYSTFGDWWSITGGWSPAIVVADWVAGRGFAAACGGPGFTGHPVWLVQELATWPEPAAYDSDWAC